MSNLKISLTESQARFYELMQQPEVTHPLFVGGPGCGKSFTMALCAVGYAMHASSAEVYIYAPQHHHIKRIEVPNVLFWLNEFKIEHNGFNKHSNMIEVTDKRCGSFFFKTMDDPASMVGYQSYAAFVDELDTLSEENAREVWGAIAVRNRQQPLDLPDHYKTKWDEKKGKWFAPNKTAAFTTPEGFNFCYKTWELAKEEDIRYQKVHGDTRENPTLSSDYEQTVIDKYGLEVANDYMAGKFVNMESSSVYYNYDTVAHASFETIQPGETLRVGCDFNVDNTSATIYVIRKGKEWHAVGELYGLKDAMELASVLKVYKDSGHHIIMYPDSSGVGRSNANASVSAIAQLKNAGFETRYNTKNPRIDDRIAAMNTGLAEGRVYINAQKCPTVDRCLTNQKFDKNGKPDKRGGYDHQNDATTYPVAYEMAIRKPLFPIDFSFVNRI